MAFCNRFVALSNVEACRHAGEAGESAPNHPLSARTSRCPGCPLCVSFLPRDHSEANPKRCTTSIYKYFSR